jgi:hypothetical protein
MKSNGMACPSQIHTLWIAFHFASLVRCSRVYSKSTSIWRHLVISRILNVHDNICSIVYVGSVNKMGRQNDSKQRIQLNLLKVSLQLKNCEMHATVGMNETFWNVESAHNMQIKFEYMTLLYCVSKLPGFRRCFLSGRFVVVTLER